MKLNESEVESGRCDFCQVRPAQYTVNGGMWWICRDCMKYQYGGEEE